eukprot:30687_6
MKSWRLCCRPTRASSLRFGSAAQELGSSCPAHPCWARWPSSRALWGRHSRSSVPGRCARSGRWAHGGGLWTRMASGTYSAVVWLGKRG